MEISALVQSRKANLINVYLDGEYVATLTVDTIVKYSLYKDKSITEKDWNELLITDQVQRLYYKSLELISHRPRSLRELKNYLLQKLKHSVPDMQLAATVADQVLQKLIEGKYANDLDFAGWWVDNRLSFKGKSRAELNQELRGKGVPSDVIDSVLAGKYGVEEERELIRRIVLKKYKTLDAAVLRTDRKQFAKILAYLGRRGFRFDAVNQALEAGLDDLGQE